MSVTVIVGPMFSGKTTELIRLAKRFLLSNETVLMYKYAKDTRYVDRKALASSHDEKTFPAVAVTSLVGVDVPAVDVVCIDEGQFIDGLVDFCERAANAGLQVLVSGLYSTFQKRPFQRIADLVAGAEEIIALSAICIVCHGKAHFTRRLSSATEVEVIGGAESYVPCCRACWQQPIDESWLKTWRANVAKLKEIK